MQLSRAQAGLAPAPVSYATAANGQVVPVYTGGALPGSLPGASSAALLDLGNGATGYALNGAQLQALSSGGGVSSFFSQYGIWIALGGAALLVGGLLFSRRR